MIQEENIHCIIQARMGSTRLPGKVMKKIGTQTMLEMVVERCRLAKKIDRVIVAAHGFDVDTPAFNEWPDHLEWIDGPEDVAARFVKVLRRYPCYGFVRVCADSPFIDYDNVDAAANRILAGETYCKLGGPGSYAQGFNTDAFMLYERIMAGEDRDHLGTFYEKLMSLAVDTEADLERARYIISRISEHHTEYTADQCRELLFFPST